MRNAPIFVPALKSSMNSDSVSSLNSSSGSNLYLLSFSSKQPTLISSPDSSRPRSFRSPWKSSSAAMANVMSRCSLATSSTFFLQNWVAKLCRKRYFAFRCLQFSRISNSNIERGLNKSSNVGNFLAKFSKWNVNFMLNRTCLGLCTFLWPADVHMRFATSICHLSLYAI